MIRILSAIVAVLLPVFSLAAPAVAQQTGTKTIRLVALGDSLTAGYGLNQGEAFPVVLEKELRAKGHDVEIANAGVSGDTVQGGLERLDWSVPEGTDGVILELGANDMLRGLGPAQTRQGLEEIVKRLRARNIKVLLAGMQAAPNLGRDYGDKFNAIYPELAKQYGVALYPFFLDGVAGDSGLTLPDGMHPNGAGVKVIVGRILPNVEAFIAGIAAGK